MPSTTKHINIQARCPECKQLLIVRMTKTAIDKMRRALRLSDKKQAKMLERHHLNDNNEKLKGVLLRLIR